jgi:macrolide-specific efflux system membrane fusion protein
LKTRTKIIVGVIAGLAVVGGGIATAVSLSSQPDPLEQLITDTVEVRTISTTVAASGEVQAVDQLGVKFAAAGDVAEVLVEAGDEVSAGDTLATLNDFDLRAAVTAAESTVATRIDGVQAANLAEAQAQQAINTADQALAAADLALEAAKDVTSNRKESVANANRQIAAAEAQRDTAEYQQARVPAQKSAAYAALESAETALAQAEANLAKATLRAPMSGTILSVSVERGDSVTTAGADLFVIADLGAFEVTAEFAEADIVEIVEGQPVLLEFDALPEENRDGEVTNVALQGVVDASGGSLTTYEVTVSVPNPPKLW